MLVVEFFFPIGFYLALNSEEFFSNWETLLQLMNYCQLMRVHGSCLPSLDYEMGDI